MEKIYEENSTRGRKNNNLSIVLSFVVAIFAIVSLIAVGFNQISYAAEGDETAEPISVKLQMVHNAADIQNDSSVEVERIYDDTSGRDGINVPMMYLDSAYTKPIFCVEHGASFPANGSSYEPEESSFVDMGLTYIINQSSLMGGPGIVKNIGSLDFYGEDAKLDANAKKALETYATQVAIWKYLYDQYSDNKKGTYTADQLTSLTGNVVLRYSRNTLRVVYNGNLYENGGIKEVVERAKTATSIKTISASLASTNITKIEGTDIYQTDRISVVANPSSDLEGYYVDIAPTSNYFYVVDKDGKEVDTLTHRFGPSDYFYIRIPESKITDDNNTANFSVSGDWKNYHGGTFYVAGGTNQTIMTVTDANPRIWNDASISFMVTPPTGMTTAQTIYFIGLIVLLCGVGIIYANAKPVEEK